jgi:hypothetical protein
MHVRTYACMHALSSKNYVQSLTHVYACVYVCMYACMYDEESWLHDYVWSLMYMYVSVYACAYDAEI